MSPRGHRPVSGSRSSSSSGGWPGEGQHVGGPVNVPHVGVDLADARVVGEQHADLAGQGHPLRRQGRGDDPPQAVLQPLGRRNLRVDQNLMVHDPLSLF